MVKYFLVAKLKVGREVILSEKFENLVKNGQISGQMATFCPLFKIKMATKNVKKVLNFGKNWLKMAVFGPKLGFFR